MSTGILVNESQEKQTTEQSTLLDAGAEIAANGDLENVDWLQQLRAEAWAKFEATPQPKRTDEQWRFANLKALDLSQYQRPMAVSECDSAALIERSSGLAASAGKMVFANDELIQQIALPDSLLAKGVIWTTIERAAIEHEALFREYFMSREIGLGSEKFIALHKAMTRSGTFLYVPKNVEVELPLEVFHWLHGENGSTFPHTLLIAAENSRVTLVDYFESSDEAVAGFACGVNDLHLAAGAQLNYVCVQNWSRKALALQVNTTIVGRDATAKTLNINLGGAYARSESVSRMVGEGARSEMFAANIANGERELDQRTYQDHRVPNTSSDLLYKNALDDKARTIFAGLIRVEPGAHKTDAYQKVRNLLLSDAAEANSMPGLEIKADDVRCTHGATSGEVSTEELFYFLSRGIPAQVAQRLIAFGFLNEVIERFGNEKIGEKLAALIHTKFD